MPGCSWTFDGRVWCWMPPANVNPDTTCIWTFTLCNRVARSTAQPVGEVFALCPVLHPAEPPTNSRQWSVRTRLRMAQKWDVGNWMKICRPIRQNLAHCDEQVCHGYNRKWRRFICMVLSLQLIAAAAAVVIRRGRHRMQMYLYSKQARANGMNAIDEFLLTIWAVRV